ncbi:ABC transporter ATP-binding protein [Flavobacteriaceae bacterium F08102]|nr:ABC transporter ATP-binding protein [Flavobacteriaceae bacterium F08102]
MKEPIVKLNNLSHKYGKDWAIKNISFEVSNRGVLGLLGSNGAGKSTTMNILCGALNQTEGEAFINGIDIKTNSIEAKKMIGFLPQKAPLYLDLTVHEYLYYCANLKLIPQEKIEEAIEVAKEKCGITHFSNRLLRNLSGGYQQRVGIAQAIIHNPPLVVLDEPTNGLDPVQIIEVRNLIKDIGKDRSVILSTHILSEVQATCDTIKMIEKGNLIFSGTLNDFNNYIVPETLIMKVDNLLFINELEEVEGVKEAHQVEEGILRVHFNKDDMIRERLIEMSVTKDWKLKEIYLEKSSLDDVFTKLMKEVN